MSNIDINKLSVVKFVFDPKPDVTDILDLELNTCVMLNPDDSVLVLKKDIVVSNTKTIEKNSDVVVVESDIKTFYTETMEALGMSAGLMGFNLNKSLAVFSTIALVRYGISLPVHLRQDLTTTYYKNKCIIDLNNILTMEQYMTPDLIPNEEKVMREVAHVVHGCTEYDYIDNKRLCDMSADMVLNTLDNIRSQLALEKTLLGLYDKDPV